MNDTQTTHTESQAFSDQFETLTEFGPMRWQQRLHDEHFGLGKLPSAVSVPTGLGKTAVMAIWLIALAQQMKSGQIILPRRLVYVVDRRAVVDQATQFAENLRANLQKDAAKGLRDALGMGEGESLPISTLRGQFVDNRDWLADPSRPAIIVGTVDMIGSRLLFEGYGVSRKMRPYHAGLLGADTLVLLDESHLVPPFEALLAEIANGPTRYGVQDAALANLIPKFQLLPLSATGRRQTAQPFRLEERDFHDPDDAIAQKRLFAEKRLTLRELGDKKLEDALAEQAWAVVQDTQEQAESENSEATLKPLRVIVYCASRDVAEKTRQALDKKAKKTAAAGRTELFVGARRVKERTDAEQRLKDLGFLGDKTDLTAPAFLVATSAGEVGIDLDADHLVCDLVAWERMVQRFGRVNRRGGEGRQAKIMVIHSVPKEPKTVKPVLPKQEVLIEPQQIEKPKSPGKKDPEAYAAYLEKKAKYDAFKKDLKEYEKKKNEQEAKQQKYNVDGAAYRQAWAETFLYRKRLILLKRYVKGDVSPESLRQLSAHASKNERLARLIYDVSSPTPLRPALNRALVDAWSMTSLPEHTGRPEVAPWLRGWVDDKPQTTVVWRKYLPVRKEPAVTRKEIEYFFEAAPVHVSETLSTESWRVFDWLKKRAAKLDKMADDKKVLESDDVVAMVLKPDESLIRPIMLRELISDGADKKKRLQGVERDITGNTLCVDARFSGWKDGLLKDDSSEVVPTADDENEWLPPIDGQPVIRFRILEQSSESTEDNWRENQRFVLVRSAEGEATHWLSIQKWRDTSNTENDRAEGRPQALGEHQCWAAERAEKIGKRLNLPDHYITMLKIAARRHDEGKQAKCWQRAFRAERDAKEFKIDGPLAKTRGPINQAVLGGYRHEFGSLPYAKDDPGFKQLPEELQDLALHLIAAHHGFARPLISTKGCDDLPPSALEERAREVALRFARLQKRWGTWGLAWWEALLRAADVQASRDNENRADN